MPILYKKTAKPFETLTTPAQQKTCRNTGRFSIHNPLQGYLLFGTALPQQLLHLRQLVGGDILPLQKRRKQANDFRLIGMGKDRCGKILFSCQCGGKGPAIGLASLDKTCFPDGTLLQEAV